MTTPPAPVVLITGASSGLGQATAELLSASGFRVFGTSRAPRPDPAQPYTMLPLDVRSDESAQACVEAVLAQAERIDVLINNAGLGLAGALEEASLAQAQALFETNFFGVVRMVNAALPHMRRQRRGTIINISSLVGFGGSPFEGFYCASKHAIEGYSETLRQEVKSLGIHVAMVEPGGFQSDFGRANQEPERPISDYAAMRGRARAVFDTSIATGQSPQVIAQLILRILRTPRPRLRHLSGRDCLVFALGKRTLPEPVAEILLRLVYRLDNRPIPEGMLVALMNLIGVWRVGPPR
ncbi:MAG: SDR family NAD(P)-dependent oxidoreductase [Oscillochloris sp.]|nr:SDR family NAD(P)-dependent oxidoreductase [Oscillochloris sp.]